MDFVFDIFTKKRGNCLAPANLSQSNLNSLRCANAKGAGAGRRGGSSKGNHGLLSVEDGGTEGGAEEGGVINCT